MRFPRCLCALSVFSLLSLLSLTSLCHSERSEESGNQCDSISALCSRQILRLRYATLRMTKGEVCREDSGRAECVWRVVYVHSLFSLCPQDDTLTLGGIAAVYYHHKNTKGDRLVAFSISTLAGI